MHLKTRGNNMAFDPTLDPVVAQTTQGVTANDIKTYGHSMDLFAHQSILDAQAEGRRGRMLAENMAGALTARAIDVILGRQISDAVSDAIGGQVGAKVAESTPPESAVSILGPLQALFQQQQGNLNQVITQLMSLLAQNPVGTPVK
jgi:hypothetical protein